MCTVKHLWTILLTSKSLIYSHSVTQFTTATNGLLFQHGVFPSDHSEQTTFYLCSYNGFVYLQLIFILTSPIFSKNSLLLNKLQTKSGEAGLDGKLQKAALWTSVAAAETRAAG